MACLPLLFILIYFSLVPFFPTSNQTKIPFQNIKGGIPSDKVPGLHRLHLHLGGNHPNPGAGQSTVGLTHLGISFFYHLRDKKKNSVMW